MPRRIATYRSAPARSPRPAAPITGKATIATRIEAFEEAYVIAPSPGLLFDLAQAHRLAGHCREAAWLYRRYLATNPAEERAALARAELDAVARCAERALPTPAVAAARTDARPLAVAAPRPEPAARRRPPRAPPRHRSGDRRRRGARRGDRVRRRSTAARARRTRPTTPRSRSCSASPAGSRSRAAPPSTRPAGTRADTRWPSRRGLEAPSSTQAGSSDTGVNEN